MGGTTIVSTPVERTASSHHHHVSVARWPTVGAGGLEPWTEVPRNRETVVDVWVRCDEAAVYRLWTAAGDYLGELPTASTTLSKAALTVDIHWR
jgi:hypothetical protein